MGKPMSEEARKQRREAEEKRKRQEREQQEARAKESSRQAWINDGGDAGSFEKAWPELRAEQRKKQILKADDAARQQVRQQVRNTF